ncbi:MAG: cell division protein FtsZ [Bacteroidales bacterium]|nr:cell division protein FtsZ [Bacteroidales bacterium]
MPDVPIGWTSTTSSLIKVVGVGGGGCNAVSYMYKQGIHNVDFIICNTDAQALRKSPVPVQIRLGKDMTDGLGAGNKPAVGEAAARESADDIRAALDANTKMVFITAGMGGGTGTGAAPIIAKIAKEADILTVAIVTLPFQFEGSARYQQALRGIEALKDNVDALLVINNEKLREMCGNLTISQAFSRADDILTTAAKGIAELITNPGQVNVDFADVRTIMTQGGITIMGSAKASGENRAGEAVEAALTSPLLNNNNITGASRILLNITSGVGDCEITMDEFEEITTYVQHAVSKDALIVWGTGTDEALNETGELSVTIVATHFDTRFLSDELSGV